MDGETSLVPQASSFLHFFSHCYAKVLKKFRYSDCFLDIFEINISFLVNYCYNPPILQLQENIDLMGRWHKFAHELFTY